MIDCRLSLETDVLTDCGRQRFYTSKALTASIEVLNLELVYGLFNGNKEVAFRVFVTSNYQLL